jgi:tetratricopeptide (TPR) repeat protein
MRVSRDVGGKVQVFNAVVGSLLEVALRNADYGETHNLSICLMQRKSEALEKSGQFEEAEGILQQALTICTSAPGSGHVLSLEVLKGLAWLNFIGLQNFSEARALFQRLLQDLGHEGQAWPGLQFVAFLGLAMIAEKESAFQKAEDLLRQALDLSMKSWGAEAEQTICAAWLLERTLRDQGNDSEADHLRYSFQLKDDSII